MTNEKTVWTEAEIIENLGIAQIKELKEKRTKEFIPLSTHKEILGKLRDEIEELSVYHNLPLGAEVKIEGILKRLYAILNKEEE